MSHKKRARDIGGRVVALNAQLLKSRQLNAPPLSVEDSLQRDRDHVGTWNSAVSVVNTVVADLNEALLEYDLLQPTEGSELAAAILAARSTLAKLSSRGIFALETAYLVNEQSDRARRQGHDALACRYTMERSLQEVDIGKAGEFGGKHLKAAKEGITRAMKSEAQRGPSSYSMPGYVSPYAAAAVRPALPDASLPPARDRGERKCFHCGKPGHLSVRCTNPCSKCKKSHPGKPC